jgi:hypothetical protein
VRWNISDFTTHELDVPTDLGQVLTLTGGSSQAYADWCAHYLQWLWGDSKFQLYNHIEKYLKHNTYGA